MTNPIRSFHDLPRWVREMVAALERYEDEHRTSQEDHVCVCSITYQPLFDDVRRIAQIVAEWRKVAQEDETKTAPLMVDPSP